MIDVTHSPEETMALAAEVVRGLRGGEVVVLQGELGAGKTVFAQGMARALGIAEAVRSPTFVIVREYRVPAHPTIRELVHVDFYRLTTLEQAQDLGLSDLIGRPDVVVVTEWLPEQFALPPSVRTIRIELSILSANERRIKR